MRIQVTHDYAGRLTRERRIEPGEYDLYDPDLFGCGKHLLEIGMAVVLDDDAPADETPAPAPEPEAVEVVEFKGRAVPVKSPAKPKAKR